MWGFTLTNYIDDMWISTSIKTQKPNTQLFVNFQAPRENSYALSQLFAKRKLTKHNQNKLKN